MALQEYFTLFGKAVERWAPSTKVVWLNTERPLRDTVKEACAVVVKCADYKKRAVLLGA